MEVRRCGHCGREGTLEPVKSVVLDSREEEVAYHGGGTEDATWQTVIDVHRCSLCRAPTFSTYGWLDPFFDQPDDAVDWKVIYPPQHNVQDLPQRVGARYVELLAMLHAPDAFAVRAGRLLESICADQGVTREAGDLNARLEILVKQGNLPHALAEQAHLVRKYRNIGGHDDDFEVEEKDVPLLRGFAESLLEFLYWGPEKLARGNSRLRARRNAIDAAGGQ